MQIHCKQTNLELHFQVLQKPFEFDVLFKYDTNSKQPKQSHQKRSYSLREKCPKAEFFLVSIFLYSDSVLGHFSPNWDRV